MALRNLEVLHQLRKKFPGFDFVVASKSPESSQAMVRFINLPLRRSCDPEKYGTAPTLSELESGSVNDFITGPDLLKYLEEVAHRRRNKRRERRRAALRSRSEFTRWSFY